MNIINLYKKHNRLIFANYLNGFLNSNAVRQWKTIVLCESEAAQNGTTKARFYKLQSRSFREIST